MERCFTQCKYKTIERIFFLNGNNVKIFTIDWGLIYYRLTNASVFEFIFNFFLKRIEICLMLIFGIIRFFFFI